MYGVSHMDGMAECLWGSPKIYISTNGYEDGMIELKSPVCGGIWQGAGMRRYILNRAAQQHNPNESLAKTIERLNDFHSVVIRAYPLKGRDAREAVTRIGVNHPYELIWGVTEDAFERDEFSDSVKLGWLLQSDCRLVSKKMLEILGAKVEEYDDGWYISD